MTDGAQQALRRTMEIYSNTTRFALACNYSEKVIEAIQSRCAILRYTKLSDAQILARIIQICQKENVCQTRTIKYFYYLHISDSKRSIMKKMDWKQLCSQHKAI